MHSGELLCIYTCEYTHAKSQITARKNTEQYLYYSKTVSAKVRVTLCVSGLGVTLPNTCCVLKIEWDGRREGEGLKRDICVLFLMLITAATMHVFFPLSAVYYFAWVSEYVHDSQGNPEFSVLYIFSFGKKKKTQITAVFVFSCFAR